MPAWLISFIIVACEQHPSRGQPISDADPAGPAESQPSRIGGIPFAETICLAIRRPLLQVENAEIRILKPASRDPLAQEPRVGNDSNDLLGPPIQILETRLPARDDGVPLVTVSRRRRGGLVRPDGIELRKVDLRELCPYRAYVCPRVTGKVRVLFVEATNLG